MASHPEPPATGRLLWQVTTKWRAAVDRALAPLGLTHAQYALLGSLYGLWLSGERPSQRELADAAGLEPIYVSKLTRALERSGLLERRAHPGDPRARQLTLTEHGTTVVRQAVSIVHGLQEELTAPIGGTGGRRNRDLVHTLRALLGTPPDPTEIDTNGSDAMPPTPTLTGQDIGEAQGALSGLLDATLAGSGTSSTEYIILRVIAYRGPWTAADALRDYLAGQPQLRLGPDDAAGLLGGLERRGLVDGVASGGPVALTDEGTRLLGEVGEQVQAVTRRLYADIDADDLATAHRVLIEVTERANRLRER